MSTDIVRVIRIIEYVGPRNWVELTVEKALHGTKELEKGQRITAVTLGEYAELLYKAEEVKMEGKI